jgi:hypothetical protein
MNNQTDQKPPPPPTPPRFLDHKPARAALCAIIPGIGAVYNREYMKAVIHFSIFAGLTIISESVGIFGMAAFAFYVFTIIDAYRSAEAIARGESTASLEKSVEAGGLNLLLWGGVLIAMGILFLLDNLDAIRLRDAIQFWPVLLILLGVYLVANQFVTRQNGGPSSPVQPNDQERGQE